MLTVLFLVAHIHVLERAVVSKMNRSGVPLYEIRIRKWAAANLFFQCSLHTMSVHYALTLCTYLILGGNWILTIYSSLLSEIHCFLLVQEC
jgi:hypothetical protein